MPTSATGISINRSLAPRGFTLIEIMVVIFIIGIMVAVTVLSIGLAHGDRYLNKERDRIVALTDYMREQAGLENREYGMRCFQGGYEFLVYNARTGMWERNDDDKLMRARLLPTGLALELSVDGRKIVLPKQETLPDELTPQVLLYSSGELNLFELTLLREPDGPGVRFAPAANTDTIEAKALAVGAA